MRMFLTWWFLGAEAGLRRGDGGSAGVARGRPRCRGVTLTRVQRPLASCSPATSIRAVALSRWRAARSHIIPENNTILFSQHCLRWDWALSVQRRARIARRIESAPSSPESENARTRWPILDWSKVIYFHPVVSYEGWFLLRSAVWQYWHSQTNLFIP